MGRAGRLPLAGGTDRNLNNKMEREAKGESSRSWLRELDTEHKGSKNQEKREE